jgi:hypothetical protein
MKKKLYDGVLTTRMPDELRGVVSIRDDKYVWIIVPAPGRTPQILAFKTGIQAIVAHAVMEQVNEIHTSNGSNPNMWAMMTKHHIGLGVLCRCLVLDPDGVRHVPEEGLH